MFYNFKIVKLIYHIFHFFTIVFHNFFKFKYEIKNGIKILYSIIDIKTNESKHSTKIYKRLGKVHFIIYSLSLLIYKIL